VTIGAPLPDPTPALTPEQLARFHSEPDVPMLAVNALCNTLAVARTDPMLRAAVRGALEAAQSYDAALEVEYRQWAQFHAMYRVFEHLRREHTGDRPILARIRAAMMDFCAHHRQLLDPHQDTRERSMARLQAFSDGLLASAAGGMAFGSQTVVRGEDDVVEAEAARRTGEALQAVVAELGAEDAELLRRCFAGKQSVRTAAKEMGRSYSRTIERYHELLALLRARLVGRGVGPVWIEGVSGEVFGEGAANDGGPPRDGTGRK
jgi:hypothetical protein